MIPKDFKLPPPEDTEFWKRVEILAKALDSDGCSGVTECYQDACYLHDIMYKTGSYVDGTKVTRREADMLFRKAIQDRSVLGVASPMSWWRWAGVRVFGWKAYKGKGK